MYTKYEKIHQEIKMLWLILKKNNVCKYAQNPSRNNEVIANFTVFGTTAELQMIMHGDGFCNIHVHLFLFKEMNIF